MIKIQYCDREWVEKCHLEYVKKRIKKSAADMKSKSMEELEILLDLRKKLNKSIPLDDGMESISKIAICPYLEELVAIQKEWFKLFNEDDGAVLSKAIKNLLKYDSFYNGLEIEIDQKKIQWNRQKLLMKNSTEICPYCGRQYITSWQEKSTASCDHYYPKELYPLLSINMYNLVPSCYICNSVLKGENVKKESDLHLYPYQDASEILKFKVKIEDVESLYNISKEANSIELIISQEDDELKTLRAEKSLELFKLQEVYQYHAEDAFKLRKALKEESSEAYQKIFSENYKQLENLSEYAFSYRQKDMSEEPLVKLKRDIEEQFKESGEKT
ncbi:MAG: hypothetical protein K2H53_01895 [Clostridia bacterium]|nr:hypothetical protein [Clostridia bacterium]